MSDTYIERINEIEDAVNALYWSIRDERGYASEAKKLDTISGKVYNLKYDFLKKERAYNGTKANPTRTV